MSFWAAAAKALDTGINFIAGNNRYKSQKRHAALTSIPSVVRQAKQSGIHPLAALGSSQGYQPASAGPLAGSSIGDGLVEDLNRQSVEKSQRRADHVAERLTEVEIRRTRAEAELLEAQSRTAIEEARNYVHGRPWAVDYAAPEKPVKGTKENPFDTTAYWRTSTGRLVRGPNPDNALGAEEIPYPGLISAGDVFYGREKGEAKVTRQGGTGRPEQKGQFNGQIVVRDNSVWEWQTRGRGTGRWVKAKPE